MDAKVWPADADHGLPIRAWHSAAGEDATVVLAVATNAEPQQLGAKPQQPYTGQGPDRSCIGSSKRRPTGPAHVMIHRPANLSRYVVRGENGYGRRSRHWLGNRR